MDKTRLRKLLERDEGFRSEPYRDTEGLLTIGVGLCIERNPVLGKTYDSVEAFEKDFPEGVPHVMLEEALQDEIDGFTAKMKSEFEDCWDDLSDVQREVIVSLAFNMGVGWVGKFPSCVRNIKAGDYIGAAREMLQGAPGKYSRWSQQVGIRSARLAMAFATSDPDAYDFT